MNEFGHKFPDDEVSLVTDDVKAQAIMLQLGVLNQISQKRDPTDTTSIYIAELHPTHWLMCARIWDNPDPTENGFMIVAYPKAHFDLFAVQGAMAAYLAESTRIDVRPMVGQANKN